MRQQNDNKFCISLTSILSRRHPLWEKKQENCPLGLHEKYMRRAQTWEFFVSLLGWFSDPFKGFW